MTVRPPAFAGMFYPADVADCRALARSYVTDVPGRHDVGLRRWIGGIVPHAGWICSGAVAGQTIAALAAARSRAGRRAPDLVVVFGAVHSATPLASAALDANARWDVPGGSSPLSEELERRLLEAHSSRFRVDERFHRREHAVEVELPLIQAAWPGATILPIEVPAIETAGQIGIATAREVEKAGQSAIYLASSDLTHYGAAYGFVPVGTGAQALEWAKSNDRRLLDLVLDLAVDEIVPESTSRLNACGGGAIAAMLAACREAGATGGELLRHTNSYETLAIVAPQNGENAVGYASVVIG